MNVAHFVGVVAVKIVKFITTLLRHVAILQHVFRYYRLL